MRDDWTLTTLGLIARFRAGTAFPKRYQGKSRGQYRFVKVSDFSLPGNERKLAYANHWIGDKERSEMKAHAVSEGSIVFAKIGEGLKAERIRQAVADTLIDNNLMSATAIQGCCDPRYLYYLMSTIGLAGLTAGSAIPYLKQSDLESVQVTVPPLPTQRRIAGVLGALDDLIDTNRALADQCGTAWRVAVDSAIASGPTQGLALSDMAAFVNGRNFTKGASGTGRPVIRTPEVRVGPTPSTVRSDVEAKPYNVADVGDILFVWSGSLLVARWRWEMGLINQHVFKVIPNAGYPDWLVMYAVEAQLPWFLSLAADKATTMGHIQRAHLDEPATLPNADLWPDLDLQVRPLWDTEQELRLEAQRLAATRDELLPLLLSGRVLPGEVAA